MKSYALMGCVALFLFSIFHEAHQQLNMCSEYSNYVLPVRNEELPEVHDCFIYYDSTYLGYM